jgi:hypothetical protein
VADTPTFAGAAAKPTAATQRATFSTAASSSKPPPLYTTEPTAIASAVSAA